MDYKKALERLNQQIEDVDNEINCYLDGVDHYETRLNDVNEEDRNYILETIRAYRAIVKDLKQDKNLLIGIHNCVCIARDLGLNNVKMED